MRLLHAKVFCFQSLVENLIYEGTIYSLWVLEPVSKTFCGTPPHAGAV